MLPGTLRFHRLWRGVGVMLIVSVVAMSLWPSPPEVTVSHADKLVHVVAYFALMTWFAQLHHDSRGRLAWFVGLCVLGAMLELLQGLGSTRSAEWADALANACGVFAGWWVTRRAGGRVLVRLENRFLSAKSAGTD